MGQNSTSIITISEGVVGLLNGQSVSLSGIFSDKNNQNKLKVRIAGEKFGIGDIFLAGDQSFKIVDMKKSRLKFFFFGKRISGEVFFQQIE